MSASSKIRLLKENGRIYAVLVGRGGKELLKEDVTSEALSTAANAFASIIRNAEKQQRHDVLLGKNTIKVKNIAITLL